MHSYDNGPLPTAKRGDVVRVRFDPTEGSEQAGERPAVVLSPGFINARSPVILVAPLTGRKTERLYPFEALVEPPEGGLTLRSKVLLLHTRGVDRSRVVGHMGSVDDATMSRIEAALRIAAGLTRVE